MKIYIESLDNCRALEKNFSLGIYAQRMLERCESKAVMIGNGNIFTSR